MSERITRRTFVVRSGTAFSALALPRVVARGISRLGVADQRFLYVAEPGIRNYVEWGGIGILVYDMNDHFRFVRRVPTKIGRASCRERVSLVV